MKEGGEEILKKCGGPSLGLDKNREKEREGD